MKTLLAYLLLASAVFAAKTAFLSGTVIDSSTRLPVPGAKVELRKSSFSDALSTTTSDNTGAFRFEIREPGNYVIEAEAANYLGTRDHPGQGVVQFDENDFADGKVPVERTTSVPITRAATLSGVLKDGATQQPLEGFSVKALRITWLRGKREFHEQGAATSNKEGVFRAEVPPGDYFFLISPSHASNKIVAGRQPDYSETFPRTEAYPATYWPRGDPGAAIPFTVASGIENSAGTIDVTKAVLGRLRGTVPASQCDDGDRVNVSFEMLPYQDNALRGNVQVPCRTPFTIANLAPGKYLVSALTFPAKPIAAPTTARDPSKSISQVEAELKDAAIFIMSRNTVTELSVAEGADEEIVLDYSITYEVEAKFQCDCTQPVAPAAMQTRNILGEIQFTIVQLPEGSPPEMRNAPTRMRLPDRVARVKMAGLPVGFGLKEVLSNGIGTGAVFIPGTAAHQSLTVVLTDKPAHITASVLRDDKAVSGVHLIAARWPIEHVNDFPVYETVACNSEGNCAMDALSPTAWRIAAIPPENWDKLDLPGDLEQWLSRGEEITLQPGEFRALKLEPQD